jgi:hypothetical protein
MTGIHHIIMICQMLLYLVATLILLVMVWLEYHLWYVIIISILYIRRHSHGICNNNDDWMT